MSLMINLVLDNFIYNFPLSINIVDDVDHFLLKILVSINDVR